EPILIETGTARFDLALAMDRAEDGFLGTLEINSDLFDRRTGERFLRHFEALLSRAMSDGARSILELDLIDPGEAEEIERWAHGPARTLPARSPAALFEA